MVATNPAILSYYMLRKFVGVIALSLPFVLAGGAVLLGLLGPGHALPRPLLERSISDYYYTSMSGFYEGGLWVIAMFLMCSRGYERSDEITGYVTGAFALGVALFPSFDPRLMRYTRLQLEIGYIHTVFAALMFLSIAYFCFFLFTKSAPGRKLTKSKRHRNRVYATCGAVILVCNAVMVSITLRGVTTWRGPLHPLLCSESLALIAFGVAWLTKGKGLLRDKPHESAHHLDQVAQV